jgi:hypothetical protein
MLEQNRQLLSNNTVKTIALAAGAVIVAPTVFALLKPVAKAGIKTGVIFYQKTKQTLAETTEQFGDLVAEAKAEIQAEQAAKANLPLLDSVPKES